MEYLNITGIVKYNVRRDGDTAFLIMVSDEAAEKLKAFMAADCNDVPLKEQEDGTMCFKAHSKFNIKVYDGGVRIEDEDDAEEILDRIGAGSNVTLNVKFGEGKYKGRKYQTAYLCGLNINDLVDREEVNPFAEDETIE